ncbi:hypothetical protein [Pseudomonas vancouverensis]|uniref:Uncharacterized protein n=1 Tax=Pseudomonas vancouverensis TaxID=95300 RepID=A0A1H2PDW1_PSEVA|nr:hypothetical protein [Pseudomonas vancouverensis]KAB0497843.1 hypothetical protein F7R09_10035 [Pseudomonas vancouverensis]TDB66570.1 hypothetical protein EIY72_06805 [Pseudomonas vancouverensis]SDV15880.1 hypothetical protein SAMN05216558_5182 [Pseudomonas vancouverensis]
MNIETKDWTAQINRMPGDTFFRVQGTVTVDHPGLKPRLIFSPLQDKSFDLRLILIIEECLGIYWKDKTDKPVEYKITGDSNVSGISIFFDDKLVHHIDEILITQ